MTGLFLLDVRPSPDRPGHVRFALGRHAGTHPENLWADMAPRNAEAIRGYIADVLLGGPGTQVQADATLEEFALSEAHRELDVLRKAVAEVEALCVEAASHRGSIRAHLADDVLAIIRRQA